MWTDANMQTERLQDGPAEAVPVSEMPRIEGTKLLDIRCLQKPLKDQLPQ
jgi:hypothetical protein